MDQPIIRFFFQTSSINLSKRKKLRAFINTMLRQESKLIVSLNCIFCSDKYLLEVNRKYLLHNYYTDIITFELSENEGNIGEIYISSDRVRENAKIYNNTINQELLRVIFHGILHLCGYNDKTEKGKKTMTSKEGYYLNLWKKFSLFT